MPGSSKSARAERSNPRRRSRASPGRARPGAGRGTSPEPASRAELDAFFAGVDEMRQYLDRHIQDPERRGARLTRVAQELLRPRSAAELGQWLTAQLCEAVGARACSLLLARFGWRVWGGAAAGEPKPPSERILELARSLGDVAEPVVEGEAILVGLHGMEQLVGVIWIDGGAALDPASSALLQALADTAAVALEQTLSAESLARRVLEVRGSR